MHPSAILARLPRLLARDPLAQLYPDPKNPSTTDNNGAGSRPATSTQARSSSERPPRVSGIVDLASDAKIHTSTHSGRSEVGVGSVTVAVQGDLNATDRRPRHDAAIANPYHRDDGASAGAAAVPSSRDGELSADGDAIPWCGVYLGFAASCSFLAYIAHVLLYPFGDWRNSALCVPTGGSGVVAALPSAADLAEILDT